MSTVLTSVVLQYREFVQARTRRVWDSLLFPYVIGLGVAVLGLGVLDCLVVILGSPESTPLLCLLFLAQPITVWLCYLGL